MPHKDGSIVHVLAQSSFSGFLMLFLILCVDRQIELYSLDLAFNLKNFIQSFYVPYRSSILAWGGILMILWRKRHWLWSCLLKQFLCDRPKIIHEPKYAWFFCPYVWILPVEVFNDFCIWLHTMTFYKSCTGIPV